MPLTLRTRLPRLHWRLNFQGGNIAVVYVDSSDVWSAWEHRVDEPDECTSGVGKCVEVSPAGTLACGQQGMLEVRAWNMVAQNACHTWLPLSTPDVQTIVMRRHSKVVLCDLTSLCATNAGLTE